jgi:methylenetetrahydrofolate dehydrogenase (NADP+)/methenyltetrahydrofolate cyclohydrolase
MDYILMDGKRVANKVKEEIKSQVNSLRRRPKLVSVLVGDDLASKAYINNKRKISNEVGIEFDSIEFPLDIVEDDLREEILKLSDNFEIDGIIIEQPVPKHINIEMLATAIRPTKDVDCINPISLGFLLMGKPFFFPSTPLSVMKLLSEYGIEISGKRVVIIGRSIIVGKPLSIMFLSENATVTICHSKTKNLSEVAREADILAVAIGKPLMIDSTYIREGAVVIDIGINVVNGKIVGDVNFDEASKVASYITPVPGGVGALTTVMILNNTLEASKMHNW